MRSKLVIRLIGVSLLLVAAMMLVASIVGFVYGSDPSAVPLLFSALIVGIFGAFPQIFVRNSGQNHRITSREGYYIVVGSWSFACIFGMIPYLMYGGEFSFINALFESVSGFTTTGASILNDIEALPRGLLFWRMSTSWMGGIGIVALFSLVLPASSGNGAVLTGVEVSGIARDDAATRERSLVGMMVTTYISMTVILAILLKLLGLGWFDSVTHAMSTMSTCGFSTRNASIAAFDSVPVEMLISLFMFLASVNFCLIYSIFTRNKQRNVFQSEVARSYFFCVLACVLLVGLNLFFHKSYGSFGECLRRSVFQVCSICSTTGFATADTNIWPATSILILIFCSFVCGCSGSTSGGMKFDRLHVAYKSIKNKLASLSNPNQVNIIKIEGRPISEARVSDSKTYIIFYVLLVIVGAIWNTLWGLDLQTAFSASFACVGNVGPGFGEVGSVCNYSSLPGIVKFSSSLLMLLGRLEMFSLLFVLGIYPRKKKI